MSPRHPDTVVDWLPDPRAGAAVLRHSGTDGGDAAASSPAAGRGDGAGPQGAGGLEQLLVAPFRVAVVPTAAWTPDQPAVPSTALPPLLALIRAGLGGQAMELDAQVAEERTPAAMLALGRQLWPAAGRLLESATCPAHWVSSTGLATAEFEAVRTAVAQLLLRAASLEAFVAQCDPSRRPPEPRHVRAMLDELARVGAPGFRLALIVLLRRCPRQENLAALALSTGRGNDDIQEAAASAATHVLDAAVARHQHAAGAPPPQGDKAGPPSPRELAAEILQLAALTRCLDAMAALRPMSRMRREVGRKRVILQTVCLDSFEDCVDRCLLRPLAAARGADGVAALGGTAAALGEVGAALCELGDRHGTERAIHRAGQQVRTLLDDGDPQGTLAPRLLAALSGDSRC